MLIRGYFRGKDQRGEEKPIQASIVTLRQKFLGQLATIYRHPRTHYFSCISLDNCQVFFTMGLFITHQKGIFPLFNSLRLWYF